MRRMIAALVLLLVAAHAAGAQRAVTVRTAEVVLAEQAAHRGDWSDAIERAKVIAAAYAQSTNTWSVTDIIAAGRAYVILGARDPHFFHDALQAFDRAAARDSTNIDARLRAADLLLDKYNAPDAVESYQQVLKLVHDEPHALLGLARAFSFSGDPKATEAVRASIRVDSMIAPAHVLLAQLHLGAEAYDSAAAQAAKAIAIDSSSVQAWAIVGAIAWLRGDSTRFAAARTPPRNAPSRDQSRSMRKSPTPPRGSAATTMRS